MTRLTTLLLHNNMIHKFGTNLSSTIHKLTSLMMNNNKLSSFSELMGLKGCKTLEHLSLLENPIYFKPNYRVYVIYLLPQLKVLDFQKITDEERKETKEFFQSLSGKTFLTMIEQEKQQEKLQSTEQMMNHSQSNKSTKLMLSSLTNEQKTLIKKAIEKASTKDEIDQIETEIKVKNICLFLFVLFYFCFIFSLVLLILININ